jgi:hypothetical protein
MADYRVQPGEATEDKFTSAIERQTSQLPSTTFLSLAAASIVASLTLKIMGRDNWALFVGQWAPTFLILGNYNKMVKQQGSDASSRYSGQQTSDQSQFQSQGIPRAV